MRIIALILALLLVGVGCKQLTRKAHWTPPPQQKQSAKLLIGQPPPPPPPLANIVSLTFMPVEDTNTWAKLWRYPIFSTNYLGRFTNYSGSFRAQMSVVVEWESVAGKIYAVEWSPIAADGTPIVDSTGRTNGAIGQGWFPISLPVQAASTVTRWTGGVWSDSTEQRFYRIREL